MTSVKWIAEGGDNLAVGTSDACLQIWDVAQVKYIYTFSSNGRFAIEKLH